MANFKKKVDEVDTVAVDTLDEVVEKKSDVKQKKVFKDTDLISCLSITQGEMFFDGKKSGMLYTWAQADDVAEIEFRDLNYAVRSKDKMVFKPRFVIQDEDFIELYPQLKNVYGSMYSTDDLKEILSMTPSKIKRVVDTLPSGVKDSLKSIAMSQIKSGKLDSVNRIKALDEVFGTSMLQMLT